MTSYESELPPSTSSTLVLVEQTAEENIAIWNLNGASWRGPLSIEQYVGREKLLGNQALTRNGGVTYWVLTDVTKPSNQRPILASCESYKKRALVKRPGQEVEDSISYGIGSVFCNPIYRGRGYGRRMMEELGKKLDYWKQDNDRRTDFTVLYSDIGKHFYAKPGWEPFTSSHITLAPFSNNEIPTHPDLKLLHAEDLEELCRVDEQMLRQALNHSTQGHDTTSVALIPDIATLCWLHAREEYVGKEIRGLVPRVKGAYIRSKDVQMWCIWSCFFGSSPTKGNILSIIRLVVEGEVAVDSVDAAGSPESAPSMGGDARHIMPMKDLLQAAQHQAAEMAMNEVQIWNPSQLVLAAAKAIDSSVDVVHRDEDSIASLKWQDDKKPTKINWIANEKYGWC